MAAWSSGENPRAALGVLREVVRLSPTNELYETELGNAARDSGKSSTNPVERVAYFQEAWRAADGQVNHHPRNPDAWNNRGVAAMWLTQLAGIDQMLAARQSFERAVTLDPVFVDA